MVARASCDSPSLTCRQLAMVARTFTPWQQGAHVALGNQPLARRPDTFIYKIICQKHVLKMCTGDSIGTVTCDLIWTDEERFRRVIIKLYNQLFDYFLLFCEMSALCSKLNISLFNSSRYSHAVYCRNSPSSTHVVFASVMRVIHAQWSTTHINSC